MVEQGKCPQCGKAVPSDTPQGLCPACLLRRGLETNTIGDTGGASGVRWTPPAAEELAPLFPELDIIELIGRGGMGAVYKAREKQLDRLVALKILPPEIGREDSLAKSFAQRFAREAQAMAKLSHPNIVTIHSFGQREMGTGTGETAPPEPVPVSLYFFIMEYVDGLSLRQLLDAGTVSPKEALAIVPQICDALQYAHDRGIVHRDIKPENILLNRAGQVKIADFGLAKLVGFIAPDKIRDSSPLKGEGGPSGPGEGDTSEHTPAQPDVTQPGEKVMGTPQYMAPEQIDRPGEVDHRADIYSLGVVFYQMLTGELPVGRFEPPSRKVLIDVRLDEVVLRALEREPSRRYQQVSEVKTQVETIAAGSMAKPDMSGTGTTPERGQGDAALPRQDREQYDRDTIDLARQAVKAPAIGMIVAAGINAVPPLGLLVLLVAKLISAVFFGRQPLGIPWWVVIASAVLTIDFAVSIVVFLGAMRMMRLRNRGLAIAGAILALIAAPVNLIGLPFGIWALIAALANLIGLPFGIWALVVLSRREVIEAFEATRAGQPAERRASLVPALWAIMIHAVAFGAILGVFVFVVPRFEAIFRDMGMELPSLTKATLAASHIACEWSFVVFPMFLLLDTGVCLLLQYLAGPRARRWWSVILAATAAVVIATLGLGVGLPYARMMQTMVHSPDTPGPAAQPAAQPATTPVGHETITIAADKQAKAVAEAEKIAQRWIQAWKNRQWQTAWAVMLPSETAGKTLKDAWLAEVPGLISQAQLRADMGDILDVTSYPPVYSERLGSIGVPVVSCKYMFRLNPPVGPMVNQVMTVLLCEEDGNWGVKSWALSAVQAATQPASGPAQPAAATAKGKDPEVVSEFALRVLRAVKEDDLATLKSLSAGSRQGWLEVDWMTPYQQGRIQLVGEPPVGWSESDLKSVSAEIRRDVLSRNPDAATKVLQTLVQDDWAATLSPVTASQYLVMVLVRTDGGWRFATLDQSKGNLADDLAKHMANIPRNLKVLRQLDHSSASQTATSASSGPPAGSNRGAPTSQPSTFPATGPATQPATNWASTQPGGSKLEFRIAPSASSLSNAERDSYMDWLKAGKVGFWWKAGRIRGRMPDHAWLPFAGDLANAGNLVTGEYKGQKYVLVSDKPGQTMVPGEGKEAWGLAKVFATTDAMNRPAVGFELDDRGAELFTALTKANIGNVLAIVVDGKVISVPVIRAAIGKQGTILGRFTEQEVAALVQALKAGPAPAPNGANTQPTEMVITPGVGVGPITLGMSKEEVIKHLGKPVKIEGEGGYGLNYISSLGLSVLVSRSKGVFFISCWTPGATHWLHGLFVKDFRGATDKGIKMGASRDDIVRAYGKADSESGDASLLYMEYRSQGVWFMLRWGKLAKIDVVEPNVFALIPATAFSQPAGTTAPATQPATQPATGPAVRDAWSPPTGPASTRSAPTT